MGGGHCRAGRHFSKVRAPARVVTNKESIMIRRPCRDSLRSAIARRARRSLAAFALAAPLGPFALPAAGLSIEGPNLNESLLRVTTFAEGLNYPVGMATLDDGSILVAVSNGANY